MLGTRMDHCRGNKYIGHSVMVYLSSVCCFAIFHCHNLLWFMKTSESVHCHWIFAMTHISIKMKKMCRVIAIEWRRRLIDFTLTHAFRCFRNQCHYNTIDSCRCHLDFVQIRNSLSFQVFIRFQQSIFSMRSKPLICVRFKLNWN